MSYENFETAVKKPLETMEELLGRFATFVATGLGCLELPLPQLIRIGCVPAILVLEVRVLTKAGDLANDLSDAAESLGMLEQNLRRLRENIDELEESFQAAGAGGARCGQVKLEKALEQATASARRALDRILSRLEELRVIIRDWVARGSEIARRLSTLEGLLECLTGEGCADENEQKAAQGEPVDLEDILAQALEEINRIESELASLESDLEAGSEEVDEADADVDDLSDSLTGAAAAVLLSDVTIKVGNQTAIAGPDGSYSISNISAPDAFGQNGPGSVPDFRSDDFVRMVATAEILGTTYYAYSNPFQIAHGETFSVEELVIGEEPPLVPRSLSFENVETELLVGETLLLRLRAVFGDNSEGDVSELPWTSYRISNPSIARVDSHGRVTGYSPGTVFITAVNEGVAAVRRIDVVTESNENVQVTIRGTALLPTGVPAVGASVRTTFGVNTTTAADGSFVLELNVERGSRFNVVVSLNIDGARYLTSFLVRVDEDTAEIEIGEIFLQPRNQPGNSDLFPLRTQAHDLSALYWSVSTGDLDEDGDLDFAMANSGLNTVTIVLNEEAENFSGPIEYDVGGDPFSLAIADLDQDGDLDIVSGSRPFSPPNVSVLFNQGDGTFAEPIEHQPEMGISNLTVGDLNGDNWPDIVIASSRLLFLMINDGTGDFPTIREHDPDARFLDQIAIGDLDGDGDHDVVVTELFSPMIVLFNDGQGNFESAARYPVGDDPNSIALGDLDGDNDLDVVVTDSFSSAVRTLFNQGDGTLTQIAPLVLSETSNDLSDVDLVDLDGDSALDVVVVVSALSSQVMVLFNDGSGELEGRASYHDPLSNSSLASGDFDNDGTNDVVIAGGHAILPLFNQGDGSFPRQLEYAFDGAPVALGSGDLDGDGDVDIVAGMNAVPSHVSILLNEGDGVFTEAAQYGVVPPKALAVSDLDGDRDLDIVIAGSIGPAGSAISVFINEGSGNFRQPIDYLLDGNIRSLALGDLNGDTDLDVVVEGDVLENQSIVNFASVLLNQGEGTLGEAVEYPTDEAAESIALYDVDGDGDLDILAPNTSTLSVLLNDSLGVYSDTTEYSIAGASNVVPGDLNGDGQDDLLVSGSDGVYLLQKQGNGALGEPSVFLPEPFPMLDVGDLDLDGDLDLVGVGPTTVLALLNQGDDSFSELREYAVSSVRNDSVAEDIDNDGDLDVIWADGVREVIVLIINQTN